MLSYENKSTLLSGANKMVSQRTSIAFYESVTDGVKSYQNKS